MLFVSCHNILNIGLEGCLIKYERITDGIARRATEYLAKKGICIERLVKGLSRADAPAVEQALLEKPGLVKKTAAY